MTNSFMVGLGISMLLVAGLLSWLGAANGRPRRDGRAKISVAPVIYGISPITAAVLIASGGLLLIVLFASRL